MKKIISIFLTVTLVLTNFQGWDCLKQVKLFENFDLFQGIEKSYASEENTTDDGIRYYINNNAVVIAGVEDGISGDVVIPESIDGYPVTIIEENAFSDNDSITSIVIPEGVKQIEYAAFKSCSSLTKVDMPSTLKTIGMLAFQDCKSLKSIKIPEGLEDIGTYTFWYCTSLSNIELPGSLATIGDYAFIGCGSLVNISIPEGVQKIGANAFLNCTSLIKIEIPKSVNSIDDTAFEGSTIKAGGIYGYTGTYAETYANEKGIPFYIIGKDTELALNLEKHTKEEIKQYVSQNVNLSQNITYSIKPNTEAPYSAGNLSNQTLTSAVNTLNAMRYIAGISHDITLSDEYNKYAQHASLINCVNNRLSHSPDKPSGMSDELYSICSTGCGSSNLAMGGYTNLNTSIVYGWLADEDDSNISVVGHRRWVLNPTMGATGFGATGLYYAMFCFDSDGSSNAKVAWPAQVMPTDYFPGDYPWSLSFGAEIKDKDSVEITLTNKNTGKVWNFNSKSADGYFNIDNGWYGQPGCIIFRPDGVDSYKDGEIYNVKITGYFGAISYNVEFFDLEEKTTTEEKLDAPVATAVPTSYNKNKVTWTSVSGADGYQVYRATSKNGTYSLRKTVENGSPLSYTNTSLSTGKTYYYKVRAYKVVDGEKVYGEFSEVVSAKPMLSTPTATAVPTSYNKNKVTWTSVPGASGYEVYRATSENGTYSLRKTVEKGSPLSYTNTSLATGKTYYYKVRAYRIVSGNKVYGDFSEVVSAKPMLSTPTATAVPTSYNKNKVTWTSVSGASGYEVYRSTSENGTYSLRKTVTAGSSLSYTNTSLTTGKTYYYKVRAYRTVSGNKVYGDFSEVVSAKPMLSKPTVTLTTTSKKIIVKWNKISGASGYQVYRATSKTGTYSLRKTVTSGSTLSYTNTSLTTGKTYYYKVRAYRTVNGNKVYGDYSSIKYIKCK